MGDKGVERSTCPVMGGEIDFSVSTDTEQGPVFFCCRGGIGKLNADPGKFAAEPVMGNRHQKGQDDD